MIIRNFWILTFGIVLASQSAWSVDSPIDLIEYQTALGKDLAKQVQEVELLQSAAILAGLGDVKRITYLLEKMSQLESLLVRAQLDTAFEEAFARADKVSLEMNHYHFYNIRNFFRALTITSTAITVMAWQNFFSHNTSEASPPLLFTAAVVGGVALGDLVLDRSKKKLDNPSKSGAVQVLWKVYAKEMDIPPLTSDRQIHAEIDRILRLTNREEILQKLDPCQKALVPKSKILQN